MVRLDRIWDGIYNPITVTIDGNTWAVGLSKASWCAPIHLVLARLEEALQTTTGEESWVVTYADGYVTIACDVAFALDLAPGFAQFLGLSATYSGETEISSVTTPTAVIPAQKLGLGIPVQFWVRGVVGGESVVWSGPFRGLDVTVAAPYGTSLTWSPDRVAHVIWAGSDTPWSVSARGGWLALRPVAEGRQSQLMDAESASYTSYTYRGIILEEMYD